MLERSKSSISRELSHARGCGYCPEQAHSAADQTPCNMHTANTAARPFGQERLRRWHSAQISPVSVVQSSCLRRPARNELARTSSPNTIRNVTAIWSDAALFNTPSKMVLETTSILRTLASLGREMPVETQMQRFPNKGISPRCHNKRLILGMCQI